MTKGIKRISTLDLAHSGVSFPSFDVVQNKFVLTNSLLKECCKEVLTHQVYCYTVSNVQTEFSKSAQGPISRVS